MRWAGLIGLLFPIFVWSSDVENLLGGLAIEEDLSKQTVKENDGFVLVFTRQDLDRMHIRSFAELIERIPFFRYNENEIGLTDPYFFPYQFSFSQFVRLYINEREVLSPLIGNGLQVFGQMDFSYIDHVEVYQGLTSNAISRETSSTTIKLYTKNGERENTNLIGIMGGSAGTAEAYAYRGAQKDEMSYFVYADLRQFRRKPVEHDAYDEANDEMKTFDLMRDKSSANFYGQITLPHWRIEAQATKINTDMFMGSSWAITPDVADSTIENLYGGAVYDDKNGLQASVNYTFNYSQSREKSTLSPLGVKSINTPPFIETYSTSQTKLKEHLADIWVHKKWSVDKATLMVGIQNRFKHFKHNEYLLGGVPVDIGTQYDTENITTLFAESTYLLSPEQLVSISMNLDYYYENGGVHNECLPTVRTGYIYKIPGWMGKFYAFYAKMQTQPLVLFSNDIVSQGSNPLEPSEGWLVSANFKRTYDNYEGELLAGYTEIEGLPMRMLDGFTNATDPLRIMTVDLRGKIWLNREDKVESGIWVADQDLGQIVPPDTIVGAYMALYKRFGRLDTYNMLSYRSNYNELPTGWNYHVTLSYEWTRDLTAYVKGENLFDSALKTNYLRVNPLNGEITEFNEVSVYERSIMVGVEYQF